jgi:hypothetical protein
MDGGEPNPSKRRDIVSPGYNPSFTPDYENTKGSKSAGEVAADESKAKGKAKSDKEKAEGDAKAAKEAKADA